MPLLTPDLTGMTFGRLTVLRRIAYAKNAVWACRCECGRRCEVRSQSLRNKKTQSCGCLRALASRSRLREKRANGSPDQRLAAAFAQLRRPPPAAPAPWKGPRVSSRKASRTLAEALGYRTR